MATRNKLTGSDAYELLLAAIQNRTLPAGTRLREVEIAERFNISRTPVREALRRLEAQGLVAHRPHYGTSVVTLDYAQITELYQMREFLEGRAAYLAATQATIVEIELLRDLITHDRTILNDPDELIKTNRQFHRQIQTAAKNRFLTMMLDNLRVSLALVHSTPEWNKYHNVHVRAIDEHEIIVERIEARDAKGAEEAACSHVRNSFKTRIKRFAPESDSK